MSENPVGPAPASQDEALAQYLGLSREVSERLQLLREEVHASLNEEFRIITADLDQLRGILTDAAQKLSGAFRVVAAGTQEMNQALNGASGGPEAGSLAALARIVEGMNATAGTTIQSLQFEDMATQLLQHVDRRLRMVHDLSVEMSVINPSANRTPPFLAPMELDALFDRLEYYRNELRVATRKVVQQQSLDSGDIELF